jgi:uncharacterized protein
MFDFLLTTFALAASLLIIGSIVGFFQHDQFNLKWLILAILLLFINLFLQLCLVRILPEWMHFEGAKWNWVGKLLALPATLVVMSLPSFGWRRCGMTLHQNVEGRSRTYFAAIAFCIILGALVFLFKPSEPITNEQLAFQLTMPGFEEEPMFRGIFLLALNEAFRAKTRILWAPIGWGGTLSVVMFGLSHAIFFSSGVFSFDFGGMAFASVMGFVLLWFRERSGSLVLPVLIHNFTNSIMLI